jgi:hypothetical protein
MRGVRLLAVTEKAHFGMKDSQNKLCCNDLLDAMTNPPVSFLRIEGNSVLYLTVGYIQTDEGTGYFDQAVIFCPFCGAKLQDREEIQRKSTE